MTDAQNSMEEAVPALGHGEGLGVGTGETRQRTEHLERCLLGKETEKHAGSLPAGVSASVQWSWTGLCDLSH